MLQRLSLIMMVSLLYFTACGEQYASTKPSVDEETYINLIAEFELLRQAAALRNEQLRDDEQLPDDKELPAAIIDIAPEAAKTEILSHYGISEEALRAAHMYYSRDIEDQKERYRDAIDRVNAAHSKISESEKKPDKAGE